VGKGKHAHRCADLRGRGAKSTPFAHPASSSSRSKCVKVAAVGAPKIQPVGLREHNQDRLQTLGSDDFLYLGAINATPYEISSLISSGYVIVRA
jgi:hypothetical protein